MARTKTPQELAEAIAFFPPGASKMVQRLLKRAVDKEVRKIARSTKGGSRASAKQFGRSLGNSIASQLTRALKQRGATKRKSQSARQKAPDTGGRPFHFDHSIINKDDQSGQKNGSSKTKAQTKSAAHMRYIEREIAVEKTAAIEIPHEKDLAGSGREPDKGQDQTLERSPTKSSAGAAQGYIENPVKLANGEEIIFSFGNIGEKFQDRVDFWEQLEAAEKKNARVQSRLIIELPHEASAQARFEMVKTFCRKFDDMGLPYWAALHAPGKNNDARNFHAHIVYSESPAKRLIDPKDNLEKWDFSIVETYKTTSRNTRERRPYKQNQHKFFRPMTAIKAMRFEFQEVANSILTRENVVDTYGEPVRYDARSYKDMGVDVTPMKSIDRIIADKVNEGKLTVLDKGYTKKMIRAEMKEAFARRDKTTVEIIRLEQALTAITVNPKTAAVQNKKLPKGMKVSLLANLSDKAVPVIAKKIVEAQHNALTQDLMEQTTRTSIERILEATNPETIKISAAQTQNPVRRSELPDIDVASLLHQAAREELAAFELEAKSARKAINYRLGIAMHQWKTLTGLPVENSSPVMKIALDQQRAENTRTSRRQEANSPARAQFTQHQQPQRSQATERSPGTASQNPPQTRPSGPEPSPPVPEPRPPGRPGECPLSKTEAALTRMAAARSILSPLEFMRRLQAASNATGEYIKAIAAISDLDQRLNVLDALVGRKPQRDNAEPNRPTGEQQTKTSDERIQPATTRDEPQRGADITAATTSSEKPTIAKPEPAASKVSEATPDQTTPNAETAKECAARRKRERKTILAKQNRKGLGWER